MELHRKKIKKLHYSRRLLMMIIIEDYIIVV